MQSPLDDSWILSIWLVDPVGGVSLDWPQDLEQGIIYSASVFRQHFTPEFCAAHRFLQLRSLGTDDHSIWYPAELLNRLEKELLEVIENLEDSLSPTDHAELLLAGCKKLLNAARFASSIEEAGVCAT